MSRRFTLITVVLTAVVAFLIGAIFAGSGSQSSVAAGPRDKNASIGPAPKLVQSAILAPLVNFADIVDRINPAVVNIDATTRGRDPRGRRRASPETPGPLDGPNDSGPRLDL